MMIGNLRKGYQGKQEEDDEDNSTAHLHHHHQQRQQPHMISNSTEKLYSKVGSSSSRQWSSSGLRNPRIVRMSRTFGGKDRHSKVCTIRGLRDRRIRLSVPTAIQLYELQDRLGLNQPSKVIDWLIEATKDDIDKLPPLPIPLGFPQFHQQPNQTLIHDHQSSSSSHHNFGANFFDANNNSSTTTSFMDKGKWVMKTNNEEEDGIIVGSAHNLFPSGNNSSSSSQYYNNPFHSEPSNFLSLFGSHGNSVFPSSNNNNNNNNHHQVDPTSQLLFCPSTSSATTPSSLFAAPYYAPPYSSVSLETDPRIMQQQLNHIQFMASSNNNPHPLVLPSLMKPLIPTPPFSSRLLDADDKDTANPS